MKKRKVMLILLIIATTLCYLTQGTFAWFTDIVANQQTYQIGDIHYVYSGTLVNSTQNVVVVPGQPLITSDNLFLTNQSDIDTNLRVQIRYTYTDQQTHQDIDGIYTGATSDPFNSFFVLQFVPSWEYDPSDFCWHYKYDSSYVIPASTTQEGYSFPLIESVSFDGDKVDMTLSGAVFKLKFIFQAKQSSFVDWQTIGMQDIDNIVIE